MTKVAARYGVSSSFLAWVCERLNVPRPARGYAYGIGTGRNNSGLKNRLAMAAKMIGVKPITAA